MLKREIGKSIFQPNFITSSYLSLGKVERSQIHRKIMKKVFKKK
jgi:hypothetical protein